MTNGICLLNVADWSPISIVTPYNGKAKYCGTHTNTYTVMSGFFGCHRYAIASNISLFIHSCYADDHLLPVDRRSPTYTAYITCDHTMLNRVHCRMWIIIVDGLYAIAVLSHTIIYTRFNWTRRLSQLAAVQNQHHSVHVQYGYITAADANDSIRNAKHTMWLKVNKTLCYHSQKKNLNKQIAICMIKRVRQRFRAIRMNEMEYGEKKNKSRTYMNFRLWINIIYAWLTLGSQMLFFGGDFISHPSWYISLLIADMMCEFCVVHMHKSLANIQQSNDLLERYE